MRLAKHFLQAMVMLVVTLIATWWLLNLASKAPLVGPGFQKVGELATGDAYNF